MTGASTWGCPHEDAGACRRLGRECDPGLPGCVLHGRVEFARSDKRLDDEAGGDAAARARRRVERHRPVGPGRSIRDPDPTRDGS
ncbi:MAG: hypothetical protein M5U14_04265 [Acidimicrobiia bacterium]|nr:hypothetical protein [Acidimicrobiia bacterium]